MTELDDFIASATTYCRVLDEAADRPAEGFRQAVGRALARLVASAMVLPEMPPATPDPLVVAYDGLPPGVLDAAGDWYWTVGPTVEPSGPSQLPEPTLGVLADDLAEIHHDLRAVVDAPSTTPVADLVWQARFDFRSHWGRHALDALRVLLLTEDHDG